MNKDTTSLDLHLKTFPAEYMTEPLLFFFSVSVFKSVFCVHVSVVYFFPLRLSPWPVSLLSPFQDQQHGLPKIQS